jgi:hypothetical protein
MDKRLASLPLSKEVLDKTPQEVVAPLLRLLSRVDELESRLNKHSGNSDRPVALFSDGRKSCYSVNPAHFLLSLLNSTYLLLRKQSWQPSARAAFCLFPGIVLGGDVVSRWECDAL